MTNLEKFVLQLRYLLSISQFYLVPYHYPVGVVYKFKSSLVTLSTYGGPLWYNLSLSKGLRLLVHPQNAKVLSNKTLTTPL